MIKEFLTKMALKKQLKGLPPEQQEMMMKVIENNPEFFEKIAKEIEQKQKEGKSQMSASMEVMRKHQGELQQIMSGFQPSSRIKQ